MTPSENQSNPLSADTRRDFIKTTSTALAGGALVGSLPIARAAHSFDSGEIKIGLVGCGGRGTGAATQALDTFSQENRVKLTAVADPFQHRIDEALKGIKGKHGDKVDVTDRTFVGVDAFKRLIESDIDMVILTSPPGFRPLHFETAVNAGKHVFMEKPVATDAPGVRRVLAANKLAKEKKLIVAAPTYAPL